MKYILLTLEDKTNVVLIDDQSIIISDDCSFLDVFMTISYETGENRFIISKDNLAEDFFNLANKMAGNIIQKVVNYKMKLAIIGDFSKYESKALKDFMYECNNGNDIFFVDNKYDALKMFNKNI